MPRRRKPTDQIPIDFSSRQLEWPASTKFPYNEAPTTVRDVVVGDIHDSKAPLIITGYTSLIWIVDLLAGLSGRDGRGGPELESLRLLIGNEPQQQYSGGSPLSKRVISQEIADYWLAQGISLRSCGKVLEALEFCEDERAEIRSSGSRTVHAKIYATENAVTIGSSNYSRAGMELQVEGNVRFLPNEQKRFKDATTYAENIWESGDDYKDGFVELLRQLLQHVTWQEALGRACGELLEGDWLRTRLKVLDYGQLAPMWPSQEQGVAQAMWILESMGSVLIADATGSGKTRMGARLLRALLHHIIRSGRDRGDIPVLLTPPAVEDIWEEESIRNGVSVQTYSHGLLSRPDTKKGKRVGEAVRRAQILAVDEAHNFLSSASVRTSRLHRNVADHVLLFTATPLNRGPQDLLAIIDILGADNFDPKVLEIVDRVWRQHGARLEEISRGELQILKNAIQRFTVRRTKTALNRLIDAEPDKYTDRFGKPCRYPKHLPLVYPCDESEDDCQLARQIREECDGLVGLTALQSPFVVTAAQRRDGATDDTYLSWRLAGAKGLARHNVMACLRSSKMALREYLRGTVAVRDRYPDLANIKKTDTGELIQNLHRIAGKLPESSLDVSLPEYLTDAGAHKEACDAERARYAAIGAMLEDISDNREKAKANLLFKLAQERTLVVAFDSRLVTLYHLEAFLRERIGSGEKVDVLVATGESEASRDRLIEKFGLGSKSGPAIALCSDAHSQSINLPAASAVVHLDFPTVPRLAEQRVGRVDRLDSPHSEVHVYYPDDHEDFALRADEKFFDRHDLVAALLGANIPMPELTRRLKAEEARVIRVADVAEEEDAVEPSAGPWDDLNDALAPVRALVEGDGRLVPPEIYRAVRVSTAHVMSSVSVVESPREFGFFAVAGAEFGSPLWTFVDEANSVPETDLDTITCRLRELLGSSCHDREFDDTAQRVLTRMLNRLFRGEVSTYPPIIQHALHELRRVLLGYQKKVKAAETQRRQVLTGILEISSADSRQGAINLRAVAEWWLDVIQPYRLEALKARRKRKPLRLSDLRKPLRDKPLETDVLKGLFERDLGVKPLEQRIVATIIGVSDAQHPRGVRSVPDGTQS